MKKLLLISLLALLLAACADAPAGNGNAYNPYEQIAMGEIAQAQGAAAVKQTEQVARVSRQNTTDKQTQDASEVYKRYALVNAKETDTALQVTQLAPTQAMQTAQASAVAQSTAYWQTQTPLAVTQSAIAMVQRTEENQARASDWSELAWAVAGPLALVVTSIGLAGLAVFIGRGKKNAIEKKAEWDVDREKMLAALGHIGDMLLAWDFDEGRWTPIPNLPDGTIIDGEFEAGVEVSQGGVTATSDVLPNVQQNAIAILKQMRDNDHEIPDKHAAKMGGSTWDTTIKAMLAAHLIAKSGRKWVTKKRAKDVLHELTVGQVMLSPTPRANGEDSESRA
jgi:hypothetical protein